MEFDLSNLENYVENQFESFFKEELINLKNRDIIIFDLRTLLRKFSDVKQETLSDNIRQAIFQEADNFFKVTFSIKVFNEFAKEHKVLAKNKFSNDDTKVVMGLKFIEELLHKSLESNRLKWNHRKALIREILHNLENFGLHPNIYKRDSNYLLYNVIIEHNAFKINEVHKRFFMTREQLENFLIIPYQNNKKILIDGKNIPVKKIIQVRISSNLFKPSEVELLALKHNFKWNLKKNEYLDFFEFCHDVTNELLKQTIVNEKAKFETEKFNQLIKKLKDYPEVKKLLISAHKNLDNPELNRFALDNCRLALELFLNTLFNNDSSLENQYSQLGQLLLERNVTVETRNIYVQLVKGYAKFQNENIKHNVVEISQKESQLIFETTITIINFLIGE